MIGIMTHDYKYEGLREEDRNALIPYIRHMPITVKQAAIVQHGILFTMARPARHGHLIQAMAKFGCKTPITILGQGFMLSDGTFADRDRAKVVAFNTDQITTARFMNGRVFCTEDLW